MAFRYDKRFDKKYDLPLNGKMTKTNDEIKYIFDKSCVNENYSYKISYEAYYKYCYTFAHIIARCVGLEDDISDCLHDYFTFYLSGCNLEYPHINICMNVPGEKEDFVFVIKEKSSRNCYDYETGNYNNNFYDFDYAYIYINGQSEDVEYVNYKKIEGYDNSLLSEFCRNYYTGYNDYSYILLDDMNKKSKGSSVLEQRLIKYFGGCFTIISESKNEIKFTIDDFQFNEDYVYQNTLYENKHVNKDDKFYVERISANITYDKNLYYVKINECSALRKSLTLGSSGLPTGEHANIKKHKNKQTTENGVITALYDSYVVAGLKNILYELFE